ncbi:MAG: DUF1223 domain-containing protein, partial [Planctomycetota bacterium]
MRQLCLLLLTTVLVSGESPGVAVVELFTSEGCSSCPRAEEALHLLNAKAVDARAPVYCIAYHVTIWDTLQTPHGAWSDPFANALWTARHKTYATKRPSPHLPAGSVATPQFYINALPYAGGDLGALIDSALATKFPAKITLEWKGPEKLSYKVTGAPAGSSLILIVVEDKLSSDVKAGENAG